MALSIETIGQADGHKSDNLVYYWEKVQYKTHMKGDSYSIKYGLRETLNLSACANSSTNTKKNSYFNSRPYKRVKKGENV